MSDKCSDDDDFFEDMLIEAEKNDAFNLNKSDHKLNSYKKEHHYLVTKVITAEELQTMEIKFVEAQKEKQNLRKQLDQLKRNTSEEMEKLEKENDQLKRWSSQICMQKEQLKKSISELEQSTKSSSDKESSIHVYIGNNSSILPNQSAIADSLSHQIMLDRECQCCQERQKKINRLQHELDVTKKTMDDDMGEYNVVKNLEREVSRLREQLNATMEREKDLEAEISFIRGNTAQLQVSQNGTITENDEMSIRCTRSQYITVVHGLSNTMAQSFALNQQNDEIQQMQKKLMEFNKDFDEDNQQMENHEQRINELENSLEEKQKEIEDLLKVNQQRLNEIDEFKETINRNNNVIRQLTEKVDELKTQKDKFQLSLAQNCQNINSLQVNMVCLRQEIAKRDQQIKSGLSAQETNQHSLQTISQLQSQLINLNETISKLTEENNQQTSSIKKLQQSLQFLQNELSAEKRMKQSEHARLSAYILQLERLIAILRKELQQSNEASKQMEQEYKETVNKLQKQQAVLYSHFLEKDQSINSNQQVFAQLNELKVQNEKIQAQLHAQKSLREEEQNKTRSAQFNFNKQNQTLLSECQTLTQKVQSLQEQIIQLLKSNETILALEGQICLLRQNIAHLHKSLSQKSYQVQVIKNQLTSAQNNIESLELLEIYLNGQIQELKQKNYTQTQKFNQLSSSITSLKIKADKFKELQVQIHSLKNPKTIKEKFEVIKGWFELKENEKKYEYQPRPVSKVRENIELMNWIEEYFRVITSEALMTYEGDFI